MKTFLTLCILGLLIGCSSPNSPNDNNNNGNPSGSGSGFHSSVNGWFLDKYLISGWHYTDGVRDSNNFDNPIPIKDSAHVFIDTMINFGPLNGILRAFKLYGDKNKPYNWAYEAIVTKDYYDPDMGTLHKGDLALCPDGLHYPLMFSKH